MEVCIYYVYECGHSMMNQVHFASVEDEDDDLYGGFNDFSANDMTQVSHILEHLILAQPSWVTVGISQKISSKMLFCECSGADEGGIRC